MAQRFLEGLPKVHKDKLPNGAECMICREEYGTVASDNGTIEHAVLLPCAHHVGSECIAIWLSPGDGPGNSCPMCRVVFFPTHLRDYSDEESDSEGDDSEGDHRGDYDDFDAAFDRNGDGDGDEDSDGDDDEDENDEDENEDRNGNGGGEDGHEAQIERVATTITVIMLASFSAIIRVRERADRWEGQEWCDSWPLPTNQEIENSEKRAREVLLRPQPTGFTHRNPPRIHSPPADLESKVKQLACAYLSMAFRETILYFTLTKIGARIPPLGSPQNGLTIHQEEVLLWELGQRGAFSDARVRPEFMGMTNRQSWNLHRAKGKVYTHEKWPAVGQGCWATELGFGLGEE